MLLASLLLLSGCAGLIIGGAATTGAFLLHDRRTSQVLIGDEKIEIQANLALRNHQSLQKHTHINVTSYNHTVLLTGEAPSERLRKKAATAISQITNIKTIYNEILIQPISNYASRSKDSIITTQAKTRLLGIKLPDFDPTRIKIITENSIVYLMGIVKKSEGAAVAEQIRRINGVERVIKIFEYIKETPKTS